MANYVKGLPLKFVKYPLTAMGRVNFGEDGAGYDVYFYGETSGSYMQWDASLDKLCFVGTAQIDIGATADGVDVLFYGDTSGSYVMWDASDDRLEFVESKMDMTTLTETDTDPGRQIYLQRTYTGAASSAGLTGIEVRSTFNGSANSTSMEVKGGEFKARHTNANTKNVGTFKGVIGNCDSKSGGKTITSAWALEGQIDCGTGSTITTGAGCRVAYNEDGTVTNAYGLYVDGTSVWDVGLKMTASKVVTGIEMGACTTGINLTGSMTDGMIISGACSDNAIEISGTITDSLIQGTGTYGTALTCTGTPTKVIAAGSYSSMLTHQNSELITVAATDTTGWILGIGSYMRATGTDGYPFGICTLVESTDTTGTDRMQGLQSMAFLGTPGGSQAAHLKTLGGDAVAGMYAGWFKIGANSNCVCDSGSRCAPLWVDNQMSGTISGEEYAIFITCGASKVDAVFGFETTSSGWTYLFHFDETAYDQDPVSSLVCDTDGGDSNGSLKFSLNGTTKYIPYFDTAS